MKKALFFILSIIFAAQIVYAENDGSSLDNAIVLKNISKYDACRTRDEVIKEYRKSIEQWLDYVNKRFGKQGIGWEYGSQTLVGNKNVRWADKREIILLPSREKIVLYFDISEPFNLFSQELQKYKERS